MCKRKKIWNNCSNESGASSRESDSTANVHELEREFESKLHHARIVHRRVHRAKPRSTNIGNRHAELRVIEQVEELCPEIQAHAFPRKRKLFDNGEVGVDETRT